MTDLSDAGLIARVLAAGDRTAFRLWV